jgi:uncharacterized membrane protein YeiH
MMGSITGAAGGVIRDVFINEIPLIFRKEIYAMACVIDGVLLDEHLKDCDALLCTYAFKVTKRVIDKAHNLKIIANFGMIT